MILQLKPYHLDVLKEIGNIGAGNAATALSQLLGKEIDMSVPNANIVPISELPDHVGGADKEVAAIFLRIEGDAPGSMYFIASIEDTEQLIRQVTKDDSFQLRTLPYDDVGLSAIQEIGNILAGSYLSSFADFTKLHLHPSVPGLSIDMVGAILSYGLIPLSQVSDHVIVIDTRMQENKKGNEHTFVRFLLLPDPDSFQIIFEALGVATNG